MEKRTSGFYYDENPSGGKRGKKTKNEQESVRKAKVVNGKCRQKVPNSLHIRENGKVIAGKRLPTGQCFRIPNPEIKGRGGRRQGG